jgi:hypothetical protein
VGLLFLYVEKLIQNIFSDAHSNFLCSAAGADACSWFAGYITVARVLSGKTKIQGKERRMTTDAFSALKAGQFDAYVAEANKVLVRQVGDAFWKELAAQHPRSINIVDVLSSWPKEKDYEADTVLIPVLAHLPTISKEDYRKLLAIISAKNPSSYSVVGPVAEHVGRNPALALEFAQELEAGCQGSEAVQMAWADTFSSGAPRAAADYVLGYFQRHGRLPAPMKMLLLGLPDTELLEQLVFAGMGNALVDATVNPPGQDEYVWLTVVKLGIVVPYASNVLLQTVNAGNLEAIRALAGALTRLDAAEWGAQKLPLRGIIESLVEASASDQATTSRMDHVIALLISRQAGRRSALEFLATLGTKENDFTQILPSAFQAAFRDKEGFSVLLTRWLLQPGANFNSISHLIAFYHANSGAVHLDDDLILAADTQTLVKLVRRVLTLTFYGPSMCEYAGEILRIEGLGQTGLNLGAQMFNEIFTDYPGAAEDYLRAKVKEVKKGVPAAEIYRGVLANILKWRRFLNRLPKVDELRASELENIAVSSVKSRMNRDIRKGAEEKSFFASFFSKSTIVQGERFATYNRSGPPIVTPMIQSSHSIELPSSELADPLRGLIRRNRLLGDAK